MLIAIQFNKKDRAKKKLTGAQMSKLIYLVLKCRCKAIVCQDATTLTKMTLGKMCLNTLMHISKMKLTIKHCVILLNVVVLTVMLCHHADYHNAKSHYIKCDFVECHCGTDNIIRNTKSIRITTVLNACVNAV
jgi:hypothetical protein